MSGSSNKSSRYFLSARQQQNWGGFFCVYPGRFPNSGGRHVRAGLTLWSDLLHVSSIWQKAPRDAQRFQAVLFGSGWTLA